MKLIIINFRKNMNPEQTRQFDETLSINLHQLRSPLGAIRWNLEAVLASKDSNLPDNTRKKIQYAHDSAVQMIALIRDMLDISKIKNSTASGQPAMVDIGEIIEELIDSIRSETKAKKISINYDPGDGQIPELWLDPERLRGIIENLLANAINYNKIGGSITVRVRQIDENIRIEVADNGIGIPKEFQDKIFTKFYRAPNAIKFKLDGTGLGLYVVKLYLEAWHGKIWFESQPGSGTTFFLEFPALQAPNKH